MDQLQIETAVRHLKGLLRIMRKEKTARIQMSEHVVYYDRSGNTIEIKVIEGLDFIEEML